MEHDTPYMTASINLRATPPHIQGGATEDDNTALGVFGWITIYQSTTGNLHISADTPDAFDAIADHAMKVADSMREKVVAHVRSPSLEAGEHLDVAAVWPRA